jgi:hypothetical protein
VKQAALVVQPQLLGHGLVAVQVVRHGFVVSKWAVQ